MCSYCCWLTQRCESECFRAPRRHPKVQNIRKHRRTPGNAFSVVLDASPSTRRLQKQWFFQIALSPSLGWPLAGFGRYSGVRKLVPGGTFWAHSGPQRDKKHNSKKPDTSLKTLSPPPPPSPTLLRAIACFAACGGATRAGQHGEAVRRGLRGAACEARPVTRGGALRRRRKASRAAEQRARRRAAARWTNLATSRPGKRKPHRKRN